MDDRLDVLDKCQKDDQKALSSDMFFGIRDFCADGFVCLGENVILICESIVSLCPQSAFGDQDEMGALF
jgi:hypothetical protein